MPSHPFAAAWARKGLVVAVLGGLLTATVFVGDAGAAVESSVSSSTAETARGTLGAALRPGWRRDMLARVNAVRGAAGVAPLRPCPALRRSAQGYATLMATADHFGHVAPDGTQPWDRMRQQGYIWQAAGENIAAGQSSVADVMSAWVASPPHYADMVDPTFRHVGFGFAERADSTYGRYWVQTFGRGRGC